MVIILFQIIKFLSLISKRQIFLYIFLLKNFFFLFLLLHFKSAMNAGGSNSINISLKVLDSSLDSENFTVTFIRNRPRSCWCLCSRSREGKRGKEENGRSRWRAARWVLSPILRRAQGKIRPRVSGIRVSAGRKAPIRQQLQLQERYDDPKGSLPHPCCPQGVPKNHCRERGLYSIRFPF